MKVQGKVSRTQTVEGSITRDDLLALVKATLHIPATAKAEFTMESVPSLNMQMQGVTCSTHMFVTDERPIRFKISWSIDAPTEQG